MVHVDRYVKKYIYMFEIQVLKKIRFSITLQGIGIRNYTFRIVPIN